ncbi:MAG: LytR/AlgR family response regulator transcription factor [Flavobacteriales bacterium]
MAEVEKQKVELENLLVSVNSSTKKPNIISFKSATKIEFVSISDIVYCNADFGYTDIQLKNNKVITAAKPLATFEQMLEEHSFFRANKSCLINTDYIVTFFKDKNQVILPGNLIIEVSRRRRVEFLKLIK